MRYVYPRLPRSEADRLMARYESMGAQELFAEAAVSHPRAHPAPTGGHPAPRPLLVQVTVEARAAAAQWLEQDRRVQRPDAADFDRRVGAALHAAMHIMSADAAQNETWNFITLVMLPDLAVLRFPDRHPSRLLGGQRNVFRRPWWRREVLGGLTTEGDPPLGEDELVGIFERSKLARSRALARVLAGEILSYRGSDRSQFARNLTKLVRRHTGPRLLDYLGPPDLERLVADVGRSIAASD